MNARLLFAATLSLAVASSLAYGDEAQPLSREQVRADYRQAVASGTLRNHDYDIGAHDFEGKSTKTRAEVVADMNAARKANTLVGPLRNRTYNPGGTETLRPPTVTRSEVKTEVAAALRDGSLRRSDYDDVPVTISHRAVRERTAGRGRATS